MKSKATLFITFLLIFNILYAQNIDVDILKPIYNNETHFKDVFFKADAQSVSIINIGMPATIFTIGLIKHDKQLQKNAIYIGGAYIFSAVITQAAKVIIKRDRPFIAYPHFFSDRYDGGGYSFPSGHTSAAFCTATSLSLYYPKWYIIVPAYLWASSVGWARMYQGVHYPSDVLAGAIVGAGSAWIGYKIQKWLDKKNVARKNLSVN